MNYRHIYHAGNFADIFKHSVLTLIIAYLQRKPAAFRVIDTHAGTGLYDLSTAAANKTAEWQNGLGRFLAALVPGPVEQAVAAYAASPTASTPVSALLAPYMQALSAVNPQGGLRYYPGSPLFARLALRRQDRLTAIELQPQDYAELKQHFAGDYQSRILHLDGRLALKAQLPPKEKRGLILIDPPFEREDEFAAQAAGLSQALRRFAHGLYMLWYPIKNEHKIEQFIDILPQNRAGTILQAELHIRQKSPLPRLDGSGLILINPPYILSEQLRQLEPLFLRAFAEDSSACLRQNWLKGP
ncbi:MAG: 23S rRNA (adenine(2030)-N(6))-methyltransferase RlmJ [Candidatus Tokpelaia sp.]|nr:MAG: 23S rRNA (adenine(2030)-N(6))-methyltransferase RlmJ [Candidatus Tokpelaia sp.]KAA6207698.1 MAG: 23S rRNA (adenine(2030)-N(6))-methyltransferase RlmJ [Candidatus Tokpelaia sp.]